ncbi:MAG: translesion DNA synthesis-associated protein ImuA [Gammaproteobacteria bacterium]|nr:translesion DNA synthesis-associated protein ImuA [Gammaproteobacteria bacterium]
MRAAMLVVNLEQLKRDGALWQGRRRMSESDRALASGWPVLDELLGGGWPHAALVEVLSDAHQGLPLVLPLLAGLGEGTRWLVWIAPPYVPYAPALLARGIRVEQLLLIQDVSAQQRLWAAEQALKSGACGAVLVWPERVQTAQLRRLQLAAEQGACPGILFRPQRAANQGSPAALRLQLEPGDRHGMLIHILKCRGSCPPDPVRVPRPFSTYAKQPHQTGYRAPFAENSINTALAGNPLPATAPGSPYPGPGQH